MLHLRTLLGGKTPECRENSAPRRFLKQNLMMLNASTATVAIIDPALVVVRTSPSVHACQNAIFLGIVRRPSRVLRPALAVCCALYIGAAWAAPAGQTAIPDTDGRSMSLLPTPLAGPAPAPVRGRHEGGTHIGSPLLPAPRAPLTSTPAPAAAPVSSPAATPLPRAIAPPGLLQHDAALYVIGPVFEPIPVAAARAPLVAPPRLLDPAAAFRPPGPYQ